MEVNEKLPERLYKYREFNAQTLEMIVSDNLYYADPSTFNDPMDSRPSLDADLEEDELIETLMTLVEQRTTDETRAAMQAIGAKGPRAKAHIERRSRAEAVRRIAHIEYYATEPDFDPDEHKRSLLVHDIQVELLRRYEKGVVALAARDGCPLMWSHYGGQHRGICIGYSIPADAAADVHQMVYDGSRLVKVSMVAGMLAGDEAARREVDKAVLLRKAESWGYEQEWRLIGPRGVQYSTLELEEIVFGLKCELSAKYITMKVLEKRDRPVKFYEMREEPGTFKLRKDEMADKHVWFGGFPIRHLSSLELLRPRPDI